MTAKQSLKNYIAYLIGKGQSIGLLEAVKTDVPRADGIAGTRDSGMNRRHKRYLQTLRAAGSTYGRSGCVSAMNTATTVR